MKTESFKISYCSWFTTTDAYQIKHPSYGGHALTEHQIKYASGDFKNKLFKNIKEAIAIEIDTFGKDNAFVNNLEKTPKALREIKGFR